MAVFPFWEDSVHRLPLHVFRGNVNAVTYRDALHALFAPGLTNHSELQLLHQDNARAHVRTARITQQHLQPALSLDMAPLEHLRDELGCSLHAGLSS